MSNEELVLQYQSSQDDSDRRRLLGKLYQLNDGLIASVAMRYQRYDDLDDLKQEGALGFLKAVERWYPEGGATFASYAYTWIQQSIRRYLVDRGLNIRVAEHRNNQVLQLRKYQAEYERDHGRQPSRREMLKALKLTPEKLDRIEKADMIMRIHSLSEPISDEDPDATLGDMIADPCDPIVNVEEKLQQEQLSRVIWTAVDSLSDRESVIIRKRCQELKTLQEIGDELGISLDRVRQIEAQALRKLRSGKTRKMLQPFLEENAIKYGYNASGLGTFRRTGSSSVELAVLAADRDAKYRRWQE